MVNRFEEATTQLLMDSHGRPDEGVGLGIVGEGWHASKLREGGVGSGILSPRRGSADRADGYGWHRCISDINSHPRHLRIETDSAGTIGLKYTWGAGTDDLVAITTAAGQHYYVTTDKLGSVRSIAKRDGTWQLSQRFDPYGRPIARDSASGSSIGAQLRYGWTGREWDEETGFSYHRARYFDPESRRWTQEDPIGYAGGENVYAYVGGSPMESRDPSGLRSTLDDTYAPFCTI